MSGSLLFCICLAYFVAAYFIYGGFLKRVFAIDPKRPTPAHTNYDGIDYVPTPRMVLFGHHFASIAGPGPIVGPIMAAYFGWLPALIWILIGCVFVGAFHDFAALTISVRNQGKSISSIMERLMGFAGRQIFLIFCIACLILIVAIFTLLIAGMFASIPAVATASLTFIAMAPIFALCTLKGGMSLRNSSFIFVPLVFLTVAFGNACPLDLTSFGLSAQGATYIWIAVLAIYIFAASVVPVQWLLQPRDYLNSFLLYGMLLLGFVSILAYNPDIKMSSFNGMEAITADGNLTALVPALFIFIACGACSGFHALVASGTTSKQINSEKDLVPIGYGGMIVEGILGVMALVAVMAMDPSVFMELGKNQPMAFATGIASFSTALGIPEVYSKIFISLAISAFMMTSLDTATRLGRFLWQEVFMPKRKQAADDSATAAAPVLAPWRRTITNTFVAALIIVGASMLMALSGSAASIWPIFGASNQLMAALTFLAITLYLLMKESKWYIAFFPMLFMLVMSLWGIVQIVQQQWGGNLVLVCSGLFLLVMALLMVAVGIAIIAQHLRLRRTTGVSHVQLN
ncbi:MAG: carbon starvation protein A [Candidatus Anaerobiospirillum merdipullorum]|uniref:Carbon starvation protein A n=1 Tax=Candidatus Anaerobiospirillum merdipullorum TaxID=2838450 RepID=A0A9E2KN93_9GAMM|nr:carbon starvation protein A [Candidatus Anaerobiospirillum merdipullorum]